MNVLSKFDFQEELSRSHPWINFNFDLRTASQRLWLALGEAKSKCQHLAGVPLKPSIASRLLTIYLAKGVHATTAIEGNTLSEKEVLRRIDGDIDLPASQEYLGKEVDNVLLAANDILDDIEKNGINPIDPEDIMRYNGEVLDGLDLEEHVVPGGYRNVTVGVMDYRAPEARCCRHLMEVLCDWLNGDSFIVEKEEDSIVIGIVKSIVAHIYLAWIHPFGDGNGRTARLLEVRFLLEAGAPSSAAHLLSNHYNKTRSMYYRNLRKVSRNGGDIIPFLDYAVEGFVDQIREQINEVKKHQWSVAWENYVYELFGEQKTSAKRRQIKLILALGGQAGFVQRSELRRMTPELAELYSERTSKTLTRDLNALRLLGLIERTREGYCARKEIILAFLPRVKKGDIEKQVHETLSTPITDLQMAFSF